MTRLVLLLAAMLVLAGCDQDPFGFTTRRIAGEYGLNQSEGYSYTVVDRHGAGGVGILEGTVQQLGWNDRYILAFRRSAYLDDTQDGWMIIDTDTRRITGPFTDGDVARHPEVREIRPVPVHVAWKRVGGWTMFARGFLVPAMIVLCSIAAVSALQRRRARTALHP